MFYSKSWIYFHVPKTSGTNILLNCEEYGDITKGYKNNPERHNPVWYWESNTNLLEEGRDLYTTVRNPYDRVVSLWYHLSHFKAVTFEDFVLNSIELKEFLQGNVVMGDYQWDTWSRMYDHLKDKHGGLPDNLQWFKVEKDLHDLENKLGCKFTHTRHKSFPDKKKTKYYYTDKLQEVVYKRFEKDFLTFGYDKEL